MISKFDITNELLLSARTFYSFFSVKAVTAESLLTGYIWTERLNSGTDRLIGQVIVGQWTGYYSDYSLLEGSKVLYSFQVS